MEKKKKKEKRNIEVSKIFNFGNLKKKQELQEVLKFPIEMFWNIEASLKSEPAISDDLITEHHISLNTFIFYLLCLRLCFKFQLVAVALVKNRDII